jgi:hypothetical protein
LDFFFSLEGVVDDVLALFFDDLDIKIVDVSESVTV